MKCRNALPSCLALPRGDSATLSRAACWCDDCDQFIIVPPSLHPISVRNVRLAVLVPAIRSSEPAVAVATSSTRCVVRNVGNRRGESTLTAVHFFPGRTQSGMGGPIAGPFLSNSVPDPYPCWSRPPKAAAEGVFRPVLFRIATQHRYPQRYRMALDYRAIVNALIRRSHAKPPVGRAPIGQLFIRSVVNRRCDFNRERHSIELKYC